MARGLGRSTPLMASNQREERHVHPEGFTVLEIAGIRKQNCILLSGEAGRSMSVLRGVFMNLEI